MKLAALTLASIFFPALAIGQVRVEENGVIHMPPITIPLSSYVSPQARAGTAEYLNFLNSPAVEVFSLSPRGVSIEEHRRRYTEHFQPVLDRVRKLYPVQSTPANIAGVYVDVIVPQDGVAPRNKDRVLINLHGGGFVVGGRIMGALESAPVASLGKIKVVAVDYRQGPEYKYPAASEDVSAVYRELLKHYAPENIGIYGCSAGGFLTAQALAWIKKDGLPTPGALGIFCASAGGWTGGDSAYLAAPLIGVSGNDPTKQVRPSVSDVDYFSEANFEDPLVAPIKSRQLLAQFPPTLVITSGRDSAMSAAVNTHTQLVKADVDAQLHVWEGLPHAFFVANPDFPESREVWNVVVKFFNKQLSTSSDDGRYASSTTVLRKGSAK